MCPGPLVKEANRQSICDGEIAVFEIQVADWVFLELKNLDLNRNRRILLRQKRLEVLPVNEYFGGLF